MRPGEFRTETFPPPIKGWVEESAAANTPKDSAVVLDNFVPTLEGARLRAGCARTAQTGTEVPAAPARPAIPAVPAHIVKAKPVNYLIVEPLITTLVALYQGGEKVQGSEAEYIGRLSSPEKILIDNVVNETLWNEANGLSVKQADGSGSVISTTQAGALEDYVYREARPAVPAVDPVPAHYGAGPAIATLFSRDTSVPTLFAAVAPSTDGGSDGYIAAASGALAASSAAVSGLRGAEWSTTHISTAGGDYLVGVNGIDHGVVTSGLAWQRYYYGATGTGHRMHGVPTTKLSQVWNFKERLFFIEKGTLNAWYLPVKSIADTDSARITKLPLGALFEKGGNLLFGATYSMDGGDGPDDYCVFATDRGEIAVYGGIDPGSAAGSNPWRLEGRFEIAPPLNPRSHFRLGGDLAILTADGIVSLTEISRSDRVAAASRALTRPIGDAWRRAVQGSGHPLPVALWREKALLLVGVAPQDSVLTAYAMNAETGAWCKFTGWDLRCACVSGGRLFFGTDDGRVMEAERGGQDDGLSYRGVWVPKFRDFRDRRRKFANRVLVDFNSVQNAVYAVKALSDFRVDLASLNPDPIPASGSGVSAPGTGGGAVGSFTWDGSATWGGGAVWGVGVPPQGGAPGGAVWAGGASVNQSLWRGTRGVGRMLSLGLVVTANTQAAPVFEILLAQMRFEAASEF